MAAIFLLAGSTCQVYGAEPENPVQITEEGRAAGADEMPETPADVQIQNPAEQLKAPVSAPDGTLPDFPIPRQLLIMRRKKLQRRLLSLQQILSFPLLILHPEIQCRHRINQEIRDRNPSLRSSRIRISKPAEESGRGAGKTGSGRGKKSERYFIYYKRKAGKRNQSQ